jgi:putative membrane protein
MFIDYVTLMLINMTGGLVVLALFIWKDIDKENNQCWSPAFAIPGLIAIICGFTMTFSSPLPKPYDTAYGETSILLGSLFLGAALALAHGWNLQPLGIYAFFAGLTGVVIGIRIIDLGLTAQPLVSGIGFILTGCGGIFAELIILNRHRKGLRIISSVILIIAALIWVLTAILAYWIHLKPDVTP